MNAALEAELSKLTKRQKLALANRLLADTGAHAKPPGLRRSDDPDLKSELRRRLADKEQGAWLGLDEFKARIAKR